MLLQEYLVKIKWILYTWCHLKQQNNIWRKLVYILQIWTCVSIYSSFPTSVQVLMSLSMTKSDKFTFSLCILNNSNVIHKQHNVIHKTKNLWIIRILPSIATTVNCKHFCRCHKNKYVRIFIVWIHEILFFHIFMKSCISSK